MTNVEHTPANQNPLGWRWITPRSKLDPVTRACVVAIEAWCASTVIRWLDGRIGLAMLGGELPKALDDELERALPILPTLVPWAIPITFGDHLDQRGAVVSFARTWGMG